MMHLSSEDISDHNVLRLNLGVNFEIIDRVKLKTSTYTWDFVLPLPTLSDDLQHEAYMTYASVQEKVICPDSMGTSTIQGSHNRQCPPEIIELITAMMKINFDDNMEIAALILQINNSVPVVDFSTEIRGQRAIFEGGGALLSWLFGVTSKRERDAIVQRVQNLEALMSDNNKNINHVFKNLVTGEKLLNKRLTNLASYVSLATNQTREHLERIERNFKREVSWLGELLQRYIVLNKNTRDMIQHLEQFLADIQLLGARRLPVNLVPVATMINVKKTLEDNLHRSGQDVLLFPVLTDVMEYYRDPEFYYFKLNTSLVISLKIHLSAYRDMWDVYKITKLPVTINGEETRSTILEDETEYIALYRGESKDQLYITLSAMDIIQIQKQRVINSKTVYKNKANNCVMAIFNNDKVLTAQICKYTLIHTELVSRVYSLSQTLFYFTGVQEYTKQCFTHREEGRGLDKVSERGGSVVTEKKSFVLDLANMIPDRDFTGETMCKIDTTYFTLVPTLLKNGQANDKKAHTYTVNLVFVTKAFGPEKMSSVRGDTLLENYPNISFRKLKIADSSTDFVAADQKLKINFERVLNHTKMNKKLPYSHTEAILERIRFRDNFSLVEIISLVQGGVLVLLLLAFFVMAKKLRAIIALLTVIQAQLTNNRGLVMAEEEYAYDKDNDGDVSAEWSQRVADVHDIITDNLSDNYIFYLFAILILYFCRIGLMYTYERCTSPVKNALWKTDLVIRIQPLTTDRRRENPVFLCIQQITGLPRELKVMVKGQITGVVLGGQIFRHLRFVWKGTIYNSFTENAVPIKQSVSVPLFLGPWLKEILTGDYIIQPVLVNNKQLYRVEHFLTRTDVKSEDRRKGRGKKNKKTFSSLPHAGISMPDISGSEDRWDRKNPKVMFERDPEGLVMD